MYCIKLDIDGEVKYLFNARTAVYNIGYAKKFQKKEQATDYMRGKKVAKEHQWWIIKMESEILMGITPPMEES